LKRRNPLRSKHPPHRRQVVLPNPLPLANNEQQLLLPKKTYYQYIVVVEDDVEMKRLAKHTRLSKV
jgi:hypothetical protein